MALKGNLFSLPLARTQAGPLDTSSVITTGFESLTLAETWKTGNGDQYTYVGQTVTVLGSTNPEQDGIYILKSADYTNAASWEKVSQTDTTIAALSSAIENLESASSGDFTNLIAKIDTVSSNVETVSSDLADISTKLDTVSSDLDTAEVTIASQGQLITGLRTDVDAVSGKADANAAAIATKAEVDASNITASTWREKLEVNSKTEVATTYQKQTLTDKVFDDVTTVEGTLARLNTNIVANDGDITNLQTTVGDSTKGLVKSVTENTSAIAANTANIAAISGVVDTKANTADVVLESEIDTTIPDAASDTRVPSTKLVKDELTKKQNLLTYIHENQHSVLVQTEIVSIGDEHGQLNLDGSITGSAIETTLVGDGYKLPTAKAVKDAIDLVKAEVSTAYQFKGSDTYANIIAKTGMEVGDVWNSTTANGDYPKGTNYAWTGEEWDALGGEVDLSAYQTKAITVAGLSATTVEGALAEVATEIDAKQDKLQTYSEHIDNEYTFANINASNVTITSEELKITGTSNFNINDDGVNGTLIETSLEGVEGNLASAKAIKTAIDTKADANASNLTTENVASWKAKLGFITSDEVPEQVQSDWNATSGKGAILNKPVIASTSPLILESVVGVAVNSANELHNNTVELEALCYSGEYITKVTIPSTHLYDYDAYICTVTLDNLYSGRTQYTFKIQSEYDKTYTISKILQECIYGSSVDMVDISTDENGVHMEIDGNCTHIYVTLTRIFTV